MTEKSVIELSQDQQRSKLLSYAPYCVFLYREAAGNAQKYILIDLDDTTLFPHVATGRVIIKRIDYQYQITDTPGAWQVSTGVITEVDDTDGTSIYFDTHVVAMASNLNLLLPRRWPTPDNQYATGNWQPENYDHFDCEIEIVDGSYLLKRAKGLIVDEADTDWNTSTEYWNAWTSAGEPSSIPAAGDIILKVAEISGTSQLELGVTIWYDTV